MTQLIDLIKRGCRDEITRGMWSPAELDTPDKDGCTPIMHAAMLGDYHAIALLKEAGADLDLRDKEGNKAVDHAAKNGHGMAIIYLIEGGCGG